jgi:4-diphosphocytidyl-2-C-methyl-D-erythritol kinase
MIAFPNAKINLGLNIIRRRPDGFHDIETAMIPLKLSDALEVIIAPDKKPSFTSSGLEIPPDGKSNLCQRAFEVLENEFNIQTVHTHLHKIIPAGSGLGGGSTDAAFTLKLLNQIHNLGLNPSKLKDLAATLGSDCPFFIENKPMLASGRGELLEPVSLSLKGLHLLLVRPDVHVSTAQAYSMVKPRKPQKSIGEIISRPVDTWKGDLKNDFEESVFKNYPQLAEVKKILYSHGALYASMSGSGSAIFGLFNYSPDPKLFQSFPGSFIWHEEFY